MGVTMSRYAIACLLMLVAGRPSLAAGSADPRLAQKIDYQGGYKRLSVVVEDLAKFTGVTIRCGGNKNDWQVRDIPMVV